MLRHVLHPIHPDGWPFIAAAVVLAVVLAFLWAPLGWLGAMAALWCVFFFRDPWRVSPARDGLVLAPADGLIMAVEEAPPPPELLMGEAPMRRISIFLSVFDVHINRMPIAGRVLKRVYAKGKFLNASLDKASSDNERMALRISGANGAEVAVVQIAGLIARRIRCWVGEGQEVAAGERFGLIRFGSRTDVYFPLAWGVAALAGQRAVGGETVLADQSRVGELARGMEH